MESRCERSSWPWDAEMIDDRGGLAAAAVAVAADDEDATLALLLPADLFLSGRGDDPPLTPLPESAAAAVAAEDEERGTRSMLSVMAVVGCDA